MWNSNQSSKSEQLMLEYRNMRLNYHDNLRVLILEFRWKLLLIARDIARKFSRIARGIARQLRGIRGKLRGLRGKFRKNIPKFCKILKKFRTNFMVLHVQNPQRFASFSKQYLRNIKLKNFTAKIYFQGYFTGKKIKNLFNWPPITKNQSYNLRNDNWIAWELRGISRNARVSRNARKPPNCADCAGFAQSQNSRMSA